MKHFFKTNLGKVATEFFFEQIKHNSVFLLFLVAVHLIMLVVPFQLRIEANNQWNFSHQAIQGYMLVIGIIYAYSYTSAYVRKGVTRKDYFFGTTLAAIGMSIILPILIMILAGIELAIANIFQISPIIDSATFLGTYISWFSTIIVYMMTVLTYYFIGWLIGIGYYRYGWIIGFGFIALGIVFALLVDFIWFDYASLLYLTFSSSDGSLSFLADVLSGVASNAGNLPIYVSVVGNIILSGVILGVIHIFTKNVAIRVK